jgi:antitoxin VapB
MGLNIRNPEADQLARRLAALEGSAITDAVILALREAIERRLHDEDPRDTARRILASHRIIPSPTAHVPVSEEAWRELDTRR